MTLKIEVQFVVYFAQFWDSSNHCVSCLDGEYFSPILDAISMQGRG